MKTNSKVTYAVTGICLILTAVLMAAYVLVGIGRGWHAQYSIYLAIVFLHSLYTFLTQGPTALPDMPSIPMSATLVSSGLAPLNPYKGGAQYEATVGPLPRTGVAVQPSASTSLDTNTQVQQAQQSVGTPII